MSDRSEKFYEKLENIRDEYIEKADEPVKKESKDSFDLGESNNIVNIDSKRKKNVKLIYIAAAVIIAFMIGMLIKNNILSQKDKLEEKTGDDKNTSTPIPTEGVNEYNNYPASDVEKEVDKEMLSKNGVVEIEPDINWVIDLNGDGITEHVCYKKVETSDGYIPCIYVNNVLTEGCFNAISLIDKFYFTDINSEDGIYEITYQTTNDSFEYSTHMNKWNRRLFEENVIIAQVDNNISEWKFNVDNTPGLSRVKKIIGTFSQPIGAFVDLEYSSDEGRPFYVSQSEEYDVIHGSEKMKLKNDIKVHKESNIESDTDIIKSQDVLITKVRYEDKMDERCWLYIEADNGTNGWIELAYLDSTGETEGIITTINGEETNKYFDTVYGEE